MSDKTFLITYTGSDVVELEGAGVFGSGVCAFVSATTAEIAKGNKDFTVVESTPAAVQVSTKEALDAVDQAEKAAAEPKAIEAPAPAPAPAPEPKKEAAPKAEAKKPEAKKPEAKKPEAKKADDKKADDKKADAKAGDKKADDKKADAKK